MYKIYFKILHNNELVQVLSIYCSFNILCAIFRYKNCKKMYVIQGHILETP